MFCETKISLFYFLAKKKHHLTANIYNPMMLLGAKICTNFLYANASVNTSDIRRT
jgi:hypothetical protein